MTIHTFRYDGSDAPEAPNLVETLHAVISESDPYPYRFHVRRKGVALRSSLIGCVGVTNIKF